MTLDVESLIAEVQKFIRPTRERTLFSLGGRGYYENPASDMLAFFLTPDAEHGFRNLFLEALLDCINEDSRKLSFTEVTVRREAQTTDGNRIDLVVEGPEWVLLIENKIYHTQINPFYSYEAWGQSLATNKTLLMVVLSPGGTTVHQRWKPVSYRAYCTTLRQRLSDALFNYAYSKWVIFAREFILHFENELYQPTTIMTEQEADFVERNADAIVKVKRLSTDYRKYLLDLLRDRLSESVAGQNFTTKDDGWAVRCYSDTWGQSNLAFWSTSPAGPGKRFQVTVYLTGLDEQREARARTELQGMKQWREAGWLAWQTQPGFDSRERAIEELCRLARLISKLIPALPEPSPKSVIS
jgi:hypothetical protein